MIAALEWLDPNVDQYITSRAGEQKVLEVPKHWAALIGAWCRLLAGITLCAFAALAPGWGFWLLLYAGWVLVVESCWRHLQVFTDRFVVTTVRIFRCVGVISTKRSTIPLGRFTDVTVSRPLFGQLLGYGHLRFETAGQKQDLERVRFIRDIDRIDEIQRIVSTRKTLEQSYDNWTASEIQQVLDGT